MEILVHMGRAELLRSYSLLAVEFDPSLLARIDAEELPEGWREPTLTPSVQAIGNRWLQEKTSLLLQVPSAVIEGEYNYLLNPRHQDFTQLQFGTIRQFVFDPRLQK